MIYYSAYLIISGILLAVILAVYSQIKYRIKTLHKNRLKDSDKHTFFTLNLLAYIKDIYITNIYVTILKIIIYLIFKIIIILVIRFYLIGTQKELYTIIQSYFFINKAFALCIIFLISYILF